MAASSAYGTNTSLSKAGLAIVAAVMFALPATAETLRITAFGDSLTQGFGLPAPQGFVPVLEAWLHERGHDVNVINAGVSGDTTAGGLARIDWTLGDFPDAMIVTLGGNDLLRGLDPMQSRANLDGILRAAQEAGVPVLLAGMPAPGNFGPEFARDFEAMYRELADEYGLLLHSDFLGPITERTLAGQSTSGLMQGDEIHPGAEGVRLIVAEIGPKVEELLDQVREAAQE